MTDMNTTIEHTLNKSHTSHIPHPRIQELEDMLQQDGVPMEELKEAFILVNKEVLRHAELVEVMGASEIGVVTATAKRLLNVKIETAGAKKKSAGKGGVKKKLSAKAEIAAMLREATTGTDSTKEDWGSAF